MERYLSKQVNSDLARKMVFVTGPRQAGKTWLAREIARQYTDAAYLSFDDVEDATLIRKREWSPRAPLVIFDEIHKMADWKTFLKGTFDTRRDAHRFLITGSARLETFRQVGESLAGRYFHYRIYPLSVREAVDQLRMKPSEALDALNRLGGFPEPFLSGSAAVAGRWRKQYLTDLVREDVLEFSRVQEIRSMNTLVSLLRRRVGSPLSFASLGEDLQISPNTVKRYVEILESLYIVFLVRPFHRNIARSLVKEPKLYFFDSGAVDGDEGVRLENTVAVCLRKQAHWLQDLEGRDVDLYYGRTKEGREMDFIIAENGEVSECIEVKLSDDRLSPSVRHFQKMLPGARFVQIVHELPRERTRDGVEIRRAANYLAGCVV